MKYADTHSYLAVHIIAMICPSTRDQLFIKRYDYEQLRMFQL